ncbi:D-alanine--D-alanine ligase family protein [Paenibacillus daejeonensis]|uniref:D-alanine--D-alanine ligase family protein n=1 Tax=Paenibacillus daejeonensis TaxID=135193 RepID=UPI00036134DA|nr:D-alanine--D-alanine ligase family protein [Paenibacillus daejeonensis]
MATKLYLLYGGQSAEHEVSLKTALTVLNAVDKNKYVVQPIYITREGIWCQPWIAQDELREPEQLRRQPSHDSKAASIGAFLTAMAEGDSLVFPVLHGPGGEDGTVQGLLELAGVPYVGNGVLASAVGMDKLMTKRILEAHGIRQARYIELQQRDWQTAPEQAITLLEQEIGYPCYVKPANMGSSIGISRCANVEETRAGIELALRYDVKLVIEAEVVGREVQYAVMGNEQPRCSIGGEFVREPDFFDYDKKYKQGGLVQQIPAVLTPQLDEAMRETALRAFRALDGAGLMRVDFFVTDGGIAYLNEVNTLPGFTAISMYPALWRETDGTAYRELIDSLIELARERQGARRQEVLS